MLLLFTANQRHEISQFIFYSKGSGIPWDQVSFFSLSAQR